MKQIRPFLQDLDTAWVPAKAAKQALHIIGSGALMLQSDYERGTKDADLLETAGLTASVQAQLLSLAGKQSDLWQRHRMYIEVISHGLPFMAQRPRWHALSEINASLQHFEIHVLDVVDVVVTKLKRFHANDQADVRAMVDRGLVQHAALLERFEAAKDVWQDGAHGEDLPRYIENLNRVERDYLLVDESTIELPAWLGD